MQRQYLVDTWFFIAHLDKRDSHHRQARRLHTVLPASVLITHEAVLTEVLAYFADEDAVFRRAAVMTVRAALRDMRVLTVDRSLFQRALDLYDDRPDKEYSLTDCISLVIMRDQHVTHVLTNDHHFTQEGFTVLSDAP